ncbi:MAG: hypothetical protein HY912_18930 [Desulfomonile tiedjei]|uniref:4Fe-4S domain-containing protein n=1 Tax=Desulfomonile tiedjei TaxID=2358 RepID=A0A9D6V3T2_9BACT|nr:hypothetical protein [Desulfomonile tiedjei]
MAQIIIFPDQAAFQSGLEVLLAAKVSAEPLDPPDFCLGLSATSILVTGMSTDIFRTLESHGVSVSGIVPHGVFRRDVPDAGPPDSKWREILGEFHIASIKPSFTDPTRFRVECVAERSLDPLIPFMARFIRGGAFDPEGPVLAFDEDHRLVSFWDRRIVICRADDLLDAWILVRSAIELIIQAWERRDALTPEKKARLGIGSIEIFKRLPATNCGLCGHQGCMEFSLALLTGRSGLEKCPQMKEKSEYRASLEWLMRAVGLIPRDSSRC